MTSPILHAYVRISDPTQRKGGGLERQTDQDLKEFCKRYGFTPGKRIWVDDGVSAWKGLNASPDHELGKFIAEAKRGLIRRGDCLLVENWDRLSRQNPWAAVALVNDVRELGIHLGRLDRMKLLRCDSEDPGDFFDYALEAMRGHSESNAKSMRNKARWKKKRAAARENGSTITGRLPAWIRVVDGRRELIPERAATIKRIFHMTANGYGHALILKRFVQEDVPPIGKGKHWARSYLAQLLRDRRVLGELQPRLRNRDAEGEVIKDYYPRVVTEEEWYAARAGAAQRHTHPGRQAQHINIYAGLLKNALEGDSYYAFTRSEKVNRNRVLINRNSVEGKSAARSFPFVPFDEAVRKLLREIDPHAILNGDAGPDETTVLRGQLDGTEMELAAMKSFMEGKPFSPTIGQQILDLEDRQRELSERLAEARQRAEHPLSESWGQAATLWDIQDEEGLLRLQSVLRDMISTIQVLVVPRGTTRMAYVQIWFAPGERWRDYLVIHSPPKANASGRTPGGMWWGSVADLIGADSDLDLRQCADARTLEKILAGYDLDELKSRLDKSDQ